MTSLIRKATTYVKIEGTYGVDPTPTTANGLLTSAPDVGFSGDRVERNFTRNTLSPPGNVVGAKRQTIGFDTELKGANDSTDGDLATHYDPLLKSCAMKPFSVLRLPVSSASGTFTVGETITGGTSSAYGTLVRAVESNTVLELSDVTGTFQAAETVTGGTSSETAEAGIVLPISDQSGTFTVGETITGGTSSATGTLVKATATEIVLSGVTGTFEADETVTGGTSSATATTDAASVLDTTLEYRPTSTLADILSSTIYYFADAILHKLTGCRGNVQMNFPVGQYPYLTFNMTGLWNDPDDIAHPTGVTFEEHLPPQCQSAGLTIGTYSPSGINTVTLDVGNTVAEGKDMQEAEAVKDIFIPSRSPSGNIDLDVDTLANFDPFTLWKAGTKSAIAWNIGATIGNRVAVYVPEAQFSEVSYQDRDGRRVFNLPLLPTGDDDEICLQVG